MEDAANGKLIGGIGPAKGKVLATEFEYVWQLRDASVDHIREAAGRLRGVTVKMLLSVHEALGVGLPGPFGRETETPEMRECVPEEQENLPAA
eukprot:4019012-Prymnesium_polylepis.1